MLVLLALMIFISNVTSEDTKLVSSFFYPNSYTLDKYCLYMYKYICQYLLTTIRSHDIFNIQIKNPIIEPTSMYREFGVQWWLLKRKRLLAKSTDRTPTLIKYDSIKGFFIMPNFTQKKDWINSSPFFYSINDQYQPVQLVQLPQEPNCPQ